MFIKSLTLKNFRSFDSISIAPDRVNIIYGGNASGKTNLIEGVYTLLNGHSFKRRNLPLKKDSHIDTLIFGKVDLNEILIKITEGSKIIKLNGKRKDIITLKKMFPSLLFSIETFLSFRSKAYVLSLIDRMASVDDCNVIDRLVEYKKLIKIKRSILLKGKIDREALRVVNNKLIEIVNFLLDRRVEAVNKINDYLSDLSYNIEKKRLKLEYTPKRIDEDMTEKELYLKRSLISLNKSPVQITLDGMDLFTYSSVGEKKVALLILIVSIALHYNRKIKPILLVDDLEGDLDDSFRKKVFDLLIWLPNQLFLTTLGEYLYNEFNIIELAKESGS